MGARPVAKGRLGRPSSSAARPQVTGNDDGILLDYAPGRATLPTSRGSAIGRVIRRTGTKPGTVIAGRTVIPRQGKPGKGREAAERPPAFLAGRQVANRLATKAGLAGSTGAAPGTAPAWTAPKEP